MACRGEDEIKAGLPNRDVGGADAPEQALDGTVAPHQEMLAVVDPVAGRGVDERSRSTPEALAGLQQSRPKISLGQADGGGETSDPAAYDDDAAHGRKIPASQGRPAAASFSCHASLTRPCQTS